MALVKYNNNSLSAITSTGLTAGAMTLIKSQTASSSSTISFVNGTSDVVLDSTYPIYVFKFINIHPATDSAMLQFQVDTGTNTSYNQTITSSNFNAVHSEVDDDTSLAYRTARDLAQSTSFQSITEGVDNDNDSCATGTLHLFSPASTVFVKHFISTTQSVINYPETNETFCAGYINTTTAITRVQFKMNSGNMDSGTIKLYGIS